MANNTKSESKIKMIFDSVKFPLIAIVLSFFIGAIFIVIAGHGPIDAYKLLYEGSFGSVSKFGQTLFKTTPLILTGLSVAFAYRCGLFNIGAEGQFVIGSITTVAAAWIFQGLPSLLLITLSLLFGALGGAFWAFIPGILKSKRGVHEVIVSIMLNYAAIYVSNYIVRVLLNPSVLVEGSEYKAYSVLVPDEAKLTKLSEIIPAFGTSSVSTAFIIAVIMAIVTWFVLFKTTLGYEVRSVGNNPHASEYGGISIAKNITLSMVLSGALAGLAGATLVLGSSFKVDQMTDSAGYGFDGIAAALVGKSHPIGVIASALLFGILGNGERKMQMEGIPQETVGIIQSIIIIFIAGEQIVKYFPYYKSKVSKMFKKSKKEEVQR